MAASGWESLTPLLDATADGTGRARTIDEPLRAFFKTHGDQGDRCRGPWAF